MRRYHYFNHLDIILSIIGLFLSSILSIIIVYYAIGLQYLLACIFIAISCGSWLLKSDTSINFIVYDSTITKRVYIVAQTMFFIFCFAMAISYYLRHLQYERSLSFFIFASASAGCLFIQILASNNKNIAAILLQTMVLGISLIIFPTLMFPDLLGVDPWYHRAFTNLIITGSNIPPGFAYSKLPIFHLLIVNSILLTGLSYKLAVFLSVSLIGIVLESTLIFLIANKLIKNYKLSLLASFFIVISNQVIVMNYWVIPNSLAGLFALVLIYYLVNNPWVIQKYLIIFLIMAALIFTHTIVALFIAIVLFVYWVIPSVNNDKIIALGVALIFSISMIAWWSYASNNIVNLVQLIAWGFSIDYFSNAPAGVFNYSITIPFFETIINSLGFVLYLALAIPGLLYLSSTKNVNCITYACGIGFLLLLISFLAPIFGFAIIETRWWYLTQMVLSIAVGLTILLVLNNNKHIITKRILITSLVVLLSFLMIISSSANIDNHDLSPNSGIRYALKDSEISAVLFYNELDNGVGVDQFYARMAFKSGISIQLTNINNDIYYKSFNGSMGKIVLIREEIITRPFVLYSSIYALDYNIDNLLINNGYLKVYDSLTVRGYLII